MRIIVIILSLFAILTGCSTSSPEKETYRLARDRSFYPLNLMGKEHDFLAFADDLVIEISQLENFNVELFSTSASGLMLGLDEGDYDAILTWEIPSTANQQRYEFTEPFFPLGLVLVVNATTPYDSLKDLEGKVVGLQTGTGLRFDISKFPFVIFKYYDNVQLGLEDLANHKIDGVIMNVFPAYIYTRSFYKGRLKIISETLSNEGFRFITLLNLKENDFIQRFDSGLKKMKEDGSYHKLLEKWGLFDSEIPRTPATSVLG